MAEAAQQPKGFLGWVERAGNKLPDPVFIFFWLIGILIAFSVAASLMGYSAVHPTQLDEAGNAVVLSAVSLVSPENIQRLWVEMPQTFTHFHPLGYVLVVMLGAGVAERSGLFASAMREGVRGAPKFLLTPAVAFVAMMGNLAADAAYVVLVPLAAVLYAAAGRHPIAGIAAAFAGVSGGEFAAGPARRASVWHYPSGGGRIRPASGLGREHCRQLVLYRGDADRVFAGDLVRNRCDCRTAFEEVLAGRW